MSKNVLFLLHGIGNQDTGWSRSAQGILRSEFTRYMSHTGKSATLADDLKFVEITYNDVFKVIWQRWSTLAKSLDPVRSTPTPLTKINRFLGQAATSGSQVGNNKAVNYAGDVLLYVGFRLVRRLVLLKVMSIIARTVAKARAEDLRTEFGVLSHSMGTAVAHDALHLLATKDWAGSKWGEAAREDLADAEAAFRKETGSMSTDQNLLLNRIGRAAGPAAFSPGRMQFAGLFTVSNVSPIVSRTVNPYRSVVRPDTADLSSTVRGITDAFYNIDHALDPVSKVEEFDTNRFGDTGPRAINISVAHLYDKNVHGLDHYLLNPKAHRFIFRRLCSNFGDRESEYVDRRFSEELKAQGNPDYFARRGGNFSDETVRRAMREKLERHLVAALEKI